jgi:hypothetical protein
MPLLKRSRRECCSAVSSLKNGGTNGEARGKKVNISLLKNLKNMILSSASQAGYAPDRQDSKSLLKAFDSLQMYF